MLNFKNKKDFLKKGITQFLAATTVATCNNSIANAEIYNYYTYGGPGFSSFDSFPDIRKSLELDVFNSKKELRKLELEKKKPEDNNELLDYLKNYINVKIDNELDNKINNYINDKIDSELDNKINNSINDKIKDFIDGRIKNVINNKLTPSGDGWKYSRFNNTLTVTSSNAFDKDAGWSKNIDSDDLNNIETLVVDSSSEAITVENLGELTNLETIVITGGNNVTMEKNAISGCVSLIKISVKKSGGAIRFKKGSLSTNGENKIALVVSSNSVTLDCDSNTDMKELGAVGSVEMPINCSVSANLMSVLKTSFANGNKIDITAIVTSTDKLATYIGYINEVYAANTIVTPLNLTFKTNDTTLSTEVKNIVTKQSVGSVFDYANLNEANKVNITYDPPVEK